MSYSRWSNSCWYTYWCTSSDETMNGQHFDVAGIKTFTYGEMKEHGIDGCIELLKETIKEQNKLENRNKRKNMFMAEKHTEKEYDELKGYMREFMDDVESSEYNTPSEQYKRGEITLEEAFIEEL